MLVMRILLKVDCNLQCTNAIIFHKKNNVHIDNFFAELNMIEPVWSDGKGDFANRNASFKACDMVAEIRKSLEKIPPDHFEKYFIHVLHMAKVYFQVRNLINGFYSHDTVQGDSRKIDIGGAGSK